MSDLFLDLVSVDADKHEGGKTSDGPDLGKDLTSSTDRQSPSISSESQWRDSGHSTLVAVPNNTIQPDWAMSKVRVLLFDDGL